MEPKVNYLYYGAFFALLVLLAASSIFTKENLGGSHFFFFLYALGQVILEIALLSLCTFAIRKFLGKFCSALFIGATFIALFLHVFDYLMDRILDLSVWEALKVFVFEESLENFFYLLDASGISLWIWFILFGFLALLPILGIFLYHISSKLVEKRPMPISHSHFLQVCLCIPLALLFWDFSASKVIHPDAYTAFRKSLPWKFTFLHPENALLSRPNQLSQPITEKEAQKAIDEDQTILTKKPNIYLFIVESLREDAITSDIAPHLTRFKNESIHFDKGALANGNGTMISWFSIFYSQFPYHWKHFQSSWKMGSPALNLLKKWGYKIRLYTSAQLSYYGMEELLFGQIVDHRQTFHHSPPVSAAETDAAALARLQKDLVENPELQQGQICIVFWDCTHFDYSWPKSWSPKFTPFAQELAYFKAFQSKKTIDAIKNRYHNAVNYMDSLFGKFLQNLPGSEEAIVIFTGDHGEEFFEHGHLFHNSHLTSEQISIPLYFKFGNQERRAVSRSVISQMDIFPSVIDYLSGIHPRLFEGNSLFQEPFFPYAVTARFNAGSTPYEFSIHNGRHKLIAQFSNRKNIFGSKQLQIISLRTSEDQSIHVNSVEPWIEREFGSALDRLFDRKANL